MVKVRLLLLLIAVCFSYFLYAGTLKLYFNALSETTVILAQAEIPLAKMSTTKYRQQTVDVLAANCTYGLTQSDNSLRCATDLAYADEVTGSLETAGL